jgi:hypothetical protein
MNAVSRLRATPPSRSQVSSSLTTAPRFLAYVEHWPLLALSIIFWLGTIYILTSVPPSSLNWNWIPQLYLPLQVLTFLGLFFLASFLLLHTRRGYLAAAAIQSLIFLRLQDVTLHAQLVLSLIGIFVIIEILITSGEYLARHANLSQKSHRHHRSRHS